MKFTLIICTYQRPQALVRLLQSVQKQTVYPHEILIIDGSINEETQQILKENSFKNLSYKRVANEERGLTQQRNVGIRNVHACSEIVCFLDDDTVLEPNYFEEIIHTYKQFPEVMGVGGYIQNEVLWEPVDAHYSPKQNEFCYDGFKRKDGSRFVLRKRLGLDSDRPPGYLPEFSHGRSISFLPTSGKIYEVEQLMGGVSSFKKEVFKQFQFSSYFEGYGLYEDADFTLRLSKQGKLVVNTAAKLSHLHEAAGRPNAYRYGKMVVRNGWYVWRVKHPNPSLKAQFKWHAITLLLTAIRATNSLSSSKKKEAFTEALGRLVGWLSLFFNKPKIRG